jgi:hypothetical protein
MNNEQFQFEVNGYKYFTKLFAYCDSQSTLSHYIVCPNGKRVRLKKWTQATNMTLDDLDRWIRIGRPIEIDQKEHMDSSTLKWIELSQNQGNIIDEAILKVKSDLRLIKSIQLVLEKSPIGNDGELKPRALGQNVFVKSLDNLDLLSNIVLKESPYLNTIFYTGLFIENQLITRAVLTKDHNLFIYLGDPSEFNSIPILCCEILKKQGWEIKNFDKIGLSYSKIAKSFNVVLA